MITVLVAILTGMFTLVAPLMAQSMQGRRERDAAHDDRLWNRRAETYVSMLQFQGSGMIEGYQGSATARELAVREELTARAAAFSSDSVWTLWQTSAKAHMDLQQYVEENWPEATVLGASEDAELDARMHEDPDFLAVEQVLDDAKQRLTRKIRDELTVGTGKAKNNDIRRLALMLNGRLTPAMPGKRED